MAKTVIVSDETVRNLIEAHASLAAWYYQLSGALRDAGISAEPPTDEQRLAFVKQLASHFPELAQAAQTVTAPRAYVPPPVIPAPAEVMENEGVVVQAPPADVIAAPAMVQPPEAISAAYGVAPQAAVEGDAPPPPPAYGMAPQAKPDDAPAPPPMVDPSKVKYE